MTEQIKIETTLPPLFARAVQLKMSKDGTNYEIIAIEAPNGITCGYMSQDQPTILIISGYDKSAYQFLKKGYIAWDYVWEKLVHKGSSTDAKNLTILIQKAQQILNGDLP